MSEIPNDDLTRYMRLHVAHKQLVAEYLQLCINVLVVRAMNHDLSKFEPFEFDAYAANLSFFEGADYGSDEYKEALARIKPAIDHHFAVNRHHPEFHANGINDMTLIDLLEMVCDWMAAAQRGGNGPLRLDLQQQRFGIDPQLQGIIERTVQAIQEHTLDG